MNTEPIWDPELEQHLAELRALVEQAKPLPMSSSVVLHRGDLLQRIDDLEESMKAATADARGVLAARAAVLAESHLQAEMMVRDAQMEKERLVSDTDVYASAMREAEQIRADARAHADGLKREAEEYAASTLAGFQAELQQVLDAVQRGRSRLGEERVARTPMQRANGHQWAK